IAALLAPHQCWCLYAPRSALAWAGLQDSRGDLFMRKALLAAAALVALPVVAQAQMPAQGFHIGAEGGVNWLLNTNLLGNSVTPQTGFAAGGVIGYDFVGPRVELEGVYRNNQHNVGFPGRAVSNQ